MLLVPPEQLEPLAQLEQLVLLAPPEQLAPLAQPGRLDQLVPPAPPEQPDLKAFKACKAFPGRRV